MKTSELQGAALDWAVAKIEFPDPDYEDADRFVYIHGDDEFHFTPSTDWAQGGPIIEREKIGVSTDAFDTWMAWIYDGLEMVGIEHGPTPLIAAMRCYIASKMEDEVKVPDELLQGEEK